MHVKVLVVFIVAPKNKRLGVYTAKALQELNKKEYQLIEVRGEDVPFWLENTLKKSKDALGLTGEDLFKEYLLENYNSQLKVIKKITWNDKTALFQKPALCLLSPKETKSLAKNKDLKVCINSKYKLLAKKYLNLLERQGYTFKKTYVSGTTENAITLGIADLVIEIVYTGSSLEKYGLKIYDKIFTSDFVVIGGKNVTQ